MRGWLNKQSLRTRNTLLFCVVFLIVLIFFIAWHQLREQPRVNDETINAATKPLLRIGTAHPFLEGLVREIGTSFITTVSIEPSQEQTDVTESICSTMDIFFGISTIDGWVKDQCGGDPGLAIVFLDTYVQAQEKKIAGDAQVDPQSIYTTGYFWLSTQGAKNITRAIAQTLSSADMVHKVSYLDGSYAIGHQLDDTYKKMKDRLYDIRKAWIAGWGAEWDAIVDEYSGEIKHIVDISYNPAQESELMQALNMMLKNHTRSLFVVDATFPIQSFTTKYPAAARSVTVLDPWGDFSDTWSFSAFVEQNLLRVAQAL